MSKVRDIARFLGKTEASNTTNARLLTVGEGGLDSAAADPVIEAAAGTIDYYTSLDSLPTTNLVANTRAFVESNSRYYISNGSGWYNVALVNLSPTMTLDQSGTITLAADGTATVVTITATDSDNPLSLLSYSVESDGNGIGNFSVSQDSSVFTIAALSEDSGAQAAEFTLTFKTTDRINTATADLDFSLSFSNVVDSSAPTVLLIKADGNNATNAAITYQNSSDVSTGFTEAGDPQAGTFSPYRSGGYSVYFDGTGDYIDYGTVSAIGNVGTSDFTFEAWFYNEDFDQANYPTIFAINSYTNGLLVRFDHVGPGRDVDVYIANSSRTLTYTFNENEWYHMILTRESGTVKMWINGEYQSSFTGTLNGSITSGNIRIGTSNHIAAETWQGYITDVRFVNGTAEQTGTSDISVPTERLTLNGAELFTCHLPYITDAAGNATPTLNGNPSTQPFGPYDYEPWTADDVGGSVHFDGNDYITSGALTAPGTGDFTYEGWIRLPNTNTGSTQTIFDTSSDGFASNGFIMHVGSDRRFSAIIDDGGLGTFLVGFTDIYFDNIWYHIAAVRNNGSLNFYLDGVLINGPISYTISGTNTSIRLGATNATTPANYFTGEIANFRVTNSAVYTAAFTPPTAPLSHITNTQLLMNNKSDANIYDAAASRSFDLIGGTVTNTSTRKFTTSSSIYFPSPSAGTDGIIITDESGPMSKDQFLTSDFTIEFWVYPTAWFNNDIFMCYDAGGGNTGSFNLYNSSGIKFYADNDTDTSWDLVSAANVFSTWTNSWKHFAMTYDASAQTVKIYLDGTQEYSVGSITGWENGGSLGDYNTLAINQGATDNNKGAFRGYIQDVRVSKSVRYTSAFTPPTAEFEL